nr:hypothetical protein [Tanacetum cinerariifolium]
MMEALPKLVDEHIKKTIQTQVPSHVTQGLILEREKSQADVEKMIADAIQKERENLRQQYQLYLTIKDDPQLQQTDLPIWLALKYKFERLNMSSTTCRPSVIRLRGQDDPHDDVHLEGENSAKR